MSSEQRSIDQIAADILKLQKSVDEASSQRRYHERQLEYEERRLDDAREKLEAVAAEMQQALAGYIGS